MIRAAAVCTLLLGGSALAVEVVGATSRDMTFEIKLGAYTPMIDSEAGLVGKPYADAFGDTPMLLGELELDRQLFQAFGSLGLGLSFGYGEKFGKAIDATTGVAANESTGLRLFPLKLLAVYRWDWAAEKHNVPLVPYLKAGMVMIPWWTVKGGTTEVADGLPAQGVTWGAAGVLGLSLQLDFLDPRLARDFDVSAGVNHTYLFAEWSFTQVDDFGTGGFNLSSRHWMFGLGVEF